MNELIINLSKRFKKLLLVGDFNFPHINWNTWSVGTKDNNSKESQFIETIRDSYLEQIIKQPTRYRCNEKSNVLDLVLTDNDQRIENLEYESPLGKSDHGVLSFDFLCEIKKTHYVKTKYYYRKADFESMKAELKSIDWKVLLNQDNIDTDWKLFCDKVHGSVSKHVPIRSVIANKSKQMPLSITQRNVLKMKISYGKK